MTDGIDRFSGVSIPAHYPHGQPPDHNHDAGDLAADKFPLTTTTTVQPSKLPTYQSISLSPRDLQSIQHGGFINGVGNISTSAEAFLRNKMHYHAQNKAELKLTDHQLEDLGRIHLSQLHDLLQQKNADLGTAKGWWQRRKIRGDIKKIEKKIEQGSNKTAYDIATGLQVEHDPFKELKRLARREHNLSKWFDHDGYNSTIQTNNLVSMPSIMPNFGMGMAQPFPMMMGGMDFGMSSYMPMFPPMMPSLTQTQQFINIPSSYTSYTPPSHEHANKANYYASLAQYQSVVTLDDSPELVQMGEAAAQSNAQKMEEKKSSKTNKKAGNKNFKKMIKESFSQFPGILTSALVQIRPAEEATDDQKNKWNASAKSLLDAANIPAKQFIQNYDACGENEELQQLLQKAVDDCIQSVTACTGQGFTQADAANKENYLYSMVRPQLALLNAFAQAKPNTNLVFKALKYEADKNNNEEALSALHDALNHPSASNKTDNINKLMNWESWHGYDIMQAIFSKPDQEKIGEAYNEMQKHLNTFQQALHAFAAKPTEGIEQVLQALTLLHAFIEQLLQPPPPAEPEELRET